MKLPNTPLISMRLALMALVAICMVPMLLAIGVAVFRGDPSPLAIAMSGIVAGTALLAWRLASWISTALEELSVAVRCAGDAPIELPPARFREILHLGQAFVYATAALRDTDEMLHRREACLRTVLDTARDAIVTADGAGRIIVFNRAAENMFGISEHEAIGSKLDRLIPQHLRAGHFGQMHAMDASASFPRLMGPARVVRAQRADGSVFPIQASISCGEDGDKRYYTSILREVVDAPVLTPELAAEM